jgi:hypothetical protein
MTLPILWTVSLFAGCLMELGFFFKAMQIESNKSYAVILLGLCPSLVLAVGIPHYLTEMMLNVPFG